MSRYVVQNDFLLQRMVQEYVRNTEEAIERYGPIGTWDVSAVLLMTNIFNGLSNFNEDISGWDVSNVRFMRNMFDGATSFNQPLNSWDVSNVICMDDMFLNASSFNQPLDHWDVSKVTSMNRMFRGAARFNQFIGFWDVSSVQYMDEMFKGAISFNQPLEYWDVSRVRIMTGMFQNAHAFNQPLESWDTSNVRFMDSMFQDAYAFNQPLARWDVSNVFMANRMFQNTEVFNQPLDAWYMDATTLDMFKNARAFDNSKPRTRLSEIGNAPETIPPPSVPTDFPRFTFPRFTFPPYNPPPFSPTTLPPTTFPPYNPPPLPDLSPINITLRPLPTSVNNPPPPTANTATRITPNHDHAMEVHDAFKRFQLGPFWNLIQSHQDREITLQQFREWFPNEMLTIMPKDIRREFDEWKASAASPPPPEELENLEELVTRLEKIVSNRSVDLHIIQGITSTIHMYPYLHNDLHEADVNSWNFVYTIVQFVKHQHWSFRLEYLIRFFTDNAGAYSKDGIDEKCDWKTLHFGHVTSCNKGAIERMLTSFWGFQRLTPYEIQTFYGPHDNLEAVVHSFSREYFDKESFNKTHLTPCVENVLAQNPATKEEFQQRVVDCIRAKRTVPGSEDYILSVPDLLDQAQTFEMRGGASRRTRTLGGSSKRIRRRMLGGASRRRRRGSLF